MCMPAKGRTILFINFQPIRLSPWLHDTPRASNSQDSPRLVGVTHISSSRFSPKHTRTSSLGLPPTKRQEGTLSPSPKEEEWEMQARAEEQEIQVLLQITKTNLWKRNKIHYEEEERVGIGPNLIYRKEEKNTKYMECIHQKNSNKSFLEKWRQPPEEGKVETMKVSAFEKQPSEQPGWGALACHMSEKGEIL